MAAVEIWLRDGYRPDVLGSPVRHQKRFEYVDSSGLTGEAVAERAWKILSGLAPHRLEPADQEIRERFDASADGRGLSAGDVVIVDGKRFVCRPDGWESF